MKKIVLVSILISFNTSAIFFEYCRGNFLRSCINSNFSRLGDELRERRFRHCSSTRNLSLFESCVNQNFTIATHVMDEVYFPRYCRIPSNEISRSFIDCVNQNFNKIQKALR